MECARLLDAMLEVVYCTYIVPNPKKVIIFNKVRQEVWKDNNIKKIKVHNF